MSNAPGFERGSGWGAWSSPTVRLVNHCFTTRTSRTNRTGRAKRNMPLYGSYQFVYIGQPLKVSEEEIVAINEAAVPENTYKESNQVRLIGVYW